MPEVIQILVDKNLGITTVEDKNTFIQLLIPEFPADSCDIIIDEKASAELILLAQKEDKDLYTYYCWIEEQLKEIHGKDQIINNGRDIIVLSLSKQQFLIDTIMKFILGIRNLNFQFFVVEYWANLTPSFYGIYKQAKSTLLVLHI